MKFFKATLLFFSITLLSCGGDDASKTPENNTIQELLASTIKANAIPGMIAAIIDTDGVQLLESAGLRKLNEPAEITNDDLMHLGSCTKAMTSTLLATLVADGDLSWQTTILDVFPELANDIHPDYHDVTLHQLVTHRSGAPANSSNWGAFQHLEIKERRVALMKDGLNAPSQMSGNQYLYSNLGYMVAGSMAEKVTGTSWETLMQHRIFTPLGMTSAGFGAPGTIGQTDQPWGHYKSAGVWNPIQSDNPEALGPAGTVHATFADWAKFISLQLPGKEPAVLNRTQLDFLTEPVGDYAAGWSIQNRAWANGKTLVHNGSNTMWYVIVWVAPQLNKAFMVGTNSVDDNTFGIVDGIIGELIRYDYE